MKLYDVFTAGGIPQGTYVDRKDFFLSERISNLKNSCKMICVTGATKSGKTVLVRKIFEKDDCVKYEGGEFDDEPSFWDSLQNKLGLFNTISYSSEDVQKEGGSSVRKFGVDIKLVHGGKDSISNSSMEASSSWEQTRSCPSKSFVIDYLKENNVAIIIDDFHYLDMVSRKNIVRALKSVVLEGVPVVFIAIPPRGSDVIEAEIEMTARVENVKIPTWTEDELMKIAEQGFPLLKAIVSENILKTFCEEARGSPHLMQDFCIELCKSNGIYHTQDKDVVIESLPKNFFPPIAEGLGRRVFDKLKAGPNTKGTQRVLKRLKNGKDADTYELILLALFSMKPGVETIGYDAVRNAISKLTDSPPGKGQITNSLKHMTSISLDESASSSILDWDGEDGKLHIIDPLFSFFLKWSGPSD